jgi:CheY-like chemotaxis protein
MSPPRIGTESTDGQTSQASQPSPEGSSPVLVVEDDADTRALLVARIERLGYRVRAVSTGEDALAAASVGAVPRLVVLDLLLPGIDGWEVLRRLRADPRTAFVPVVVASILDPVDARASLHASYLVKPYRKKEFERVVRHLAGSPEAQEGQR